MSTKERLLTAYTRDVESPFLDEELFIGKSEEEWEPRAALDTESPFQSAFEQGRGQMDSPEMEEPESFDEEHFEYDLGSATNEHPLREIADGQRGQLPDGILTAILTTGESDAKDLTNRVFWQKHPDLSGKTLDPKDLKPKQRALQKEWGRILSRQVKPIIWLRQLINELDQHRGSIPREFLLGWIAAESDGNVSTVSKLGERGYFQIMWQGGEAKDQLGLTRRELRRLSTNRVSSCHLFAFIAAPAPPVFKTEHEHHMGRGFSANSGFRAPERRDATLDYAAKLKPFADLVGAAAPLRPRLLDPRSRNSTASPHRG